MAQAAQLPIHAATQLRELGFVILPGPVIPGGHQQLSDAYDRAVATADVTEVHVSRSGCQTRIDDFVNRGAEFDGIYIYPLLLAACRLIIGGPFKLSGMIARTLHAGASEMEALHVDVKQQENGWPLVGCILMIDAFDAENGATRFVPRSHLQPREPGDVMSNPRDFHEEQVLACGPAGSLIIFNASTWHGHTANTSNGQRRSIQAHFVSRESRAATNQSVRMRPETFQRIGDLAKYVLDVPSV
ncbi:MAG: phytanoyl-CoA dioxygenase family protein [Dokdonella sp.]